MLSSWDINFTRPDRSAFSAFPFYCGWSIKDRAMGPKAGLLLVDMFANTEVCLVGYRQTLFVTRSLPIAPPRKSCVSAYSWYWLKPVHRCTFGICSRGLKEIGDHYLTNFNDPIRFLIWNLLFKQSMMFVNTFFGKCVCPRKDYYLDFCFAFLTVKYYLHKNLSQLNISKRKYSGDCMRWLKVTALIE